MSLKQKFTVILAGVAFISSVAYAAGVPGNVSNVSAVLKGTTVNVQWSAMSDTAFYRVYYSHQSILNNGGDYDDVDRTQGATTNYTFASLPFASGKLYIAILAVSAEGKESEGFETEAWVDLPSASASSSSSLPENTMPVVTSIPMTVSEVKAVSGTGVLVTFTKPLLRGSVFPPRFFLVSDGSGVVLETGTGVVTGSGMSILLSTVHQAPMNVYYLTILEPVPADDGTNLPTNATKISFGGFSPIGEAPIALSSASSVSSEDIPYVRNPVLTEPVPVFTQEELSIGDTVEAPGTGLPDSGVGLFGVSIVSGLLAGRRMRRRK